MHEIDNIPLTGEAAIIGKYIMMPINDKEETEEYNIDWEVYSALYSTFSYIKKLTDLSNNITNKEKLEDIDVSDLNEIINTLIELDDFDEMNKLSIVHFLLMLCNDSIEKYKNNYAKIIANLSKNKEEKENLIEYNLKEPEILFKEEPEIEIVPHEEADVF